MQLVKLNKWDQSSYWTNSVISDFFVIKRMVHIRELQQLIDCQ